MDYDRDYIIDELTHIITSNLDFMKDNDIESVEVKDMGERIELICETIQIPQRRVVRLTKDCVVAEAEYYEWDWHKEPVPGYVLGYTVDCTDDVPQDLIEDLWRGCQSLFL